MPVGHLTLKVLDNEELQPSVNTPLPAKFLSPLIVLKIIRFVKCARLLLTKILSMFSLKLWTKAVTSESYNIVQNYLKTASMRSWSFGFLLKFSIQVSSTNSQHVRIKNVKVKEEGDLRIFCSRTQVQAKEWSDSIWWEIRILLPKIKRFLSTGDKNLAETFSSPYFARKKC